MEEKKEEEEYTIKGSRQSRGSFQDLLCWPKPTQKVTVYNKYDNKVFLHSLFSSCAASAGGYYGAVFNPIIFQPLCAARFCQICPSPS